MGINSILELISVFFGALYLILMVRENIWCWLFGILASAITVYLYIEVTLYLEAGLNIYYILAGFYGWNYWNTHKKSGNTTENQFISNDRNTTPISTWKLNYHVYVILFGSIISAILGYIMDTYTDSERPYIDSVLTIFSFVATYMEAKKILSTWYYWFFLNLFSIFLQIDRELYFFAILSVFYTVMCIYGFKRWRDSFRQQNEVA